MLCTIIVIIILIPWTCYLTYKTYAMKSYIDMRISQIAPPKHHPFYKSSGLSGSLETVSPPPLPSVRIFGDEENRASKLRKFYGGRGDKLHLGGFKGYDRMGVSNNTWNYMMGPLGVKSVLDLGCGRGISASYFYEKGAKVLCVEGKHQI